MDTGAPITFFDRGVADAVGVRFGYAGAESGSIRILGGTWRVQFEIVDLALPIDSEISWTARAGFVSSAELAMPFQGILGTDGFLDKFAVTFNKYYNYFTIERPDNFNDRVGKHLMGHPTDSADKHWRRGSKSK